MSSYWKRVNILSTSVGLGVLLVLFALSTVMTKAAGPNQFSTGIAAGDVTQTSAVLWAHSTALGTVRFDYGSDPSFTNLIGTQSATVVDPLQPVKVTLSGLTPNTSYYYRATDANSQMLAGQFRTPAMLNEVSPVGLRFGASGDWRGPLAPYPAISNADARNLDFFVALGDTIVAGGDTTSVTEFQLKHQAVYSTYFGVNTWADLRAKTALWATIDDNDVRNDFAGGMLPSLDSRFDNTGAFINETNLYRNALDVFYQYNPIQKLSYGATGDPRTANKDKLYRYQTYGQDAAIFLLDTRSFRDQPLAALTDPNDTEAALDFVTESLSNTNRTHLGQQQLADLKADLMAAQMAGLTWKFILTPAAIQNLGPYSAEERWEGYGAERTDLLRFIQNNGIQNVVFVAAGLHGLLINNLTYQELSETEPITVPIPQIHTDAFEVVVGPVAIDPPSGPYGPAAFQAACDAGLIGPFEKLAYDLADRNTKDDFMLLQANNTLSDMGFDPIGLSGSSIDATLLQGKYLAGHTYNWTEFDIHPATRVLTVTTYGLDFYTEADFTANPGNYINDTPEIVSQFRVTPKAPHIKPGAVTISGPTLGRVEVDDTFVAMVSPPNTTLPISYTWQIDGQEIVAQSNLLSNTITYSWTTTGAKNMTVIVDNGQAIVTNSHTILISDDAPGGTALLSGVSITGVATGTTNTTYTFNAAVSPISTTLPLSYTWQATAQVDQVHPGLNSITDSAQFSWPLTGTKAVMVLVSNGTQVVSATHQLEISEGDVGQNLYIPIVSR